MFIKMGHHYVNMKRIESLYGMNGELRVTTFGGINHYREIPQGEEGDKVVAALLLKLTELEDGHDNKGNDKTS